MNNKDLFDSLIDNTRQMTVLHEVSFARLVGGSRNPMKQREEEQEEKKENDNDDE